MKKKLLWVGLPVILIICVVAFIQIQYPRKTFDDLLGTNEANITKVLMRSGVTGHGVETADKGKIKELINLVNNRYYRKAFKQEFGTGYMYYYDFYSGDKVILRITGNGNVVYINDTRYNVSKEISLDLLNNWYASLSNKK